MTIETKEIVPYVFRRHDGEPITTSLNLAEVFGKQHGHVLDSIEKMLATDRKVGRPGKFKHLQGGWAAAHGDGHRDLVQEGRAPRRQGPEAARL